MWNFLLNNWHIMVLSIVYGIAFIIQVIIDKNKRKNQSSSSELKTELLENLKTTINSFIVDAEKLKHYTGEEKKQYVITRTLEIANGLMTSEEINNYVESQVALTDIVNKHT